MATIEEWLKTFESRDTVVKLLCDNGIAALPIYRLDEVAAHPQLAARGSMPALDLPYFGSTSIPVLPFRYSNAAIEVGPHLAQLGEDNYDVLAQIPQLHTRASKRVAR